MNVYECRRAVPGMANSWAGALVIAAHDEQEAIDFFAFFENRQPYEVIAWPDVTATGDVRLLCEFGLGM